MSPPFILWREVAIAYLAPALSAGAAGLATGQSGLAVAAVTSIAGTSAVVAALVGRWLHRRGRPRRWTLSLPTPVLAVCLAVLTTGLAGGLGWFAGAWLPAHTAVPDADGITRLRIDLPLSAALATVIITCRWRATLRRSEQGSKRRSKQRSDNGSDHRSEHRSDAGVRG
ncbi:hypothetical protein [Yinghuangia seranimata]|uniref:hypothetical protein n=1 Tax=Yinghuangia seranimata TaxID=408067 RepID=UPI00248B0216|nr:hypothetical protein [Yinghuangia seranimata]MDI2129902.1 hypothetical protein [Yinghuangia seranimata]